MPHKTLLICAGIGLIVVGAMVGGGLFATRGTHLHLAGEIKKTRMAELDPNRSILVFDFRVTNPADYPFVVKTAEIEVTKADGTKVVGRYVPEVDAKTIFPALPELGNQLAVTIGIGERLGPKQTVERMAAASFEMPAKELAARKSAVLRLIDVDGPVTELK